MDTNTPAAALLDRLEAVRRNADGWTARCPAHDDRTPSLSVSEGTDGRVLLHCHAGCDTKAVLDTLGMTAADLFPAGKPNGRTRREIVATYPYTDEDGALLFEVVRFWPKDFRQRRPDGRGGWTWKLGDTRRVLYRLPEVVEAVRDDAAVYLCEGEKDADRLAGLGLCATTPPGGAGKWRAEYTEALRGARVAILADNDDAGLEHAEAVARALHGTADDVRVVQLPGLAEKGDVSDWLDAGGTARDLAILARAAPPWRPDGEASDHRVPPPLSIADLLTIEEPEERWIAEGLIPAEANVLVAGYPKSHKTNFLLELGVAAATATPFLARFPVPDPVRVGMVLMEDRPHRIRRRLERLAEGHGHQLRDLDGRLHLWFRPALRLSDAEAMAELAAHVEAAELDLLCVDNWSLVASGDSNDADEVTPQLAALANLRDRRPELTVLLVHHARKTGPDRGAERLTDMIRNSSAFGAWYDAGLVLARADEQSPVKVRAELRDVPSPDPFTFTVEDEFPAGPDYGTHPDGYLRLVASDRNPALVEREAKAARFKEAVAEFLETNPGCSKRQLREGIEGNNRYILDAFELLVEEGRARYEEPEKRGKAGRCFLTVLDRASTVPGARPEETVLTVSTTPLGVGTEHTSTASNTSDRARHGSEPQSYPCAGCGRQRFDRPGVLCFSCRNPKPEVQR